MSNLEEIDNFILEWNIKYPVDRWWRKKHNIPFNSSAHRECSFVDMFFEFREDKMYEEAYKNMSNKDTAYKPDSRDFLKPAPEITDVSDEDWDDLDLDKL